MVRLSKRAQREEEERIQLELQQSILDSDGEEEQASVSVFDALSTTEEIESESEEEIVEVVKKSKKKSKKAKKSSTATPTKAAETEGMDEIDLALAALGKKPLDSTFNSTSSTPTLSSHSEQLNKLFSFETKHLDSNVELRKFFGSKIIQSTTVTQKSNQHARISNNIHHKSSIKKTPTFLAIPKVGWSTVPIGSIALQKYTGPESKVAGDWFTYTHSREYKASQYSFLETLQQADGNRLFNVLESNPYQVDCLMQISEMQTQQGDTGAATDYLAKALYALSSPLPASFNSGSFRLPYSQIENRAFFLAIARNIAILAKKGTYRTALEWCKIALGCGGGSGKEGNFEDPVGVLLWIDFLAPKAKEDEWLLSLLSIGGIEKYPGLAYAKALSLRNLEIESGAELNESSPSQVAMEAAILTFPMIAVNLLTVLGGNIPPALLSNKRTQLDSIFSTSPSYVISLLSQIYVTRSAVLWKEPTLLNWLKTTIISSAPFINDSTKAAVRQGEEFYHQGLYPTGFAPAGIIRAATLCEIPAVRPYLPPVNGTTYSYDPLPPTRTSKVATFYDDNYFEEIYGNRNESSSRTASRGVNQQTVGMMENLARLLGLGGEGGAIDIDAGLRAELLEELEELRLGAGAVPGAFPEGEEGGGGALMDRLMGMFRGNPAA